MIPEHVFIKASTITLFGLLTFLIGTRIAELETVPYTEWITFAEDLPDRIPEDEIFLYSDRLVINGQFQLARYKDTNSMLPTLDIGSTGVQLPVYSETPLYIGDIVSYRVPDRDETLVHRIIDVGIDDKGLYYVTKGDNLYYPDPFKVRKDWIQRVTIGVIW